MNLDRPFCLTGPTLLARDDDNVVVDDDEWCCIWHGCSSLKAALRQAFHTFQMNVSVLMLCIQVVQAQKPDRFRTAFQTVASVLDNPCCQPCLLCNAAA